ncbi:MAG: hypothetical protein NVSMB56_14160 [Pyrinomonadaceae bacterium]
MRAAEKFIAQGKFPAAIQEYRQLVDADPDDFTLLNALGDLYVRVSNKNEAVECFVRVASHYRQQGFSLKAIAMLKKISRLTPDSLELANNLAELYEQQGLIVEARTQYLLIADAHTRAKNTREALETMRRIADLDPQNTEIRLRLADSFHRENMFNEAAEAYADAGGRLLARKDADHALDAFIKAIGLKPDDTAALHGFVEAHAALGTADDAAAMLERIIAEQPVNTEMLSILSRAYIAAEDAPAAESVTEKLVARDNENYMRFYDVARLYLRGNSLDAAVQCLARVVETALTRRTETEPLELLNEIVARNPEHVDALQLVVRIHTWRRDDENAIVALEQLAEVAREHALEAEERGALAQLVRLAPDNESYRQRLHGAGGVPESFINFGSSENDVRATTSFADDVADVEYTSHVETTNDPHASFADLNEDPAHHSHEEKVFFEDAVSFSGEANNPADNLYEFEISTTHEDARSTGKTTTPAGDERVSAMLREELESVDFYIAQGYTDIARDTIDLLERQYGAHVEIDLRRTQLADALVTHAATENGAFIINTNDSAPAVEISNGESSFADLSFDLSVADPEVAASDETPSFVEPLIGNHIASINDSPTSTPVLIDTSTLLNDVALDAGLTEIFDEFRIAVEEDQPLPQGDFETHYHLGHAYKDMDLLDEAVEEFQHAVNMVAPNDGTSRYLNCCNLLGHCFMSKEMPRPAAMWFKKGLNAPGHTEEEYQALRYELGMAYERMGEPNNALNIFYEVYGINVSYRGVAEKLRELQAQR